MIKKFTLIAICCFAFAFLNSCTKEVGSMEAGPTASYTLNSSPAPVVAGIYVANTLMYVNNTVTLTVNVTVRGKYYIRTNAANGVFFETGGIFTSTGPKTLVLYGNGIALKDGNFIYTTTSGGSVTFSVTFLATTPPATFTYAGGSGACAAPGINGSYGTGVALGAGNYVDLTINVTSIGSYSIVTNTANGIFFSATGMFPATGSQVVRLTGIGTPASPGSFTFTPPGGCSFPINITNGGGTSIYNLDCSSPAIAGTYTVGAPLTAGNTVTIKANVTTAGTYSLSTSANGMTFSASGTFAVGPNQNIVLTGSGTPLAAGSNSFTIPGGCSFSINAVAPPPATYTLTCNATNVMGTYTVGTPLTNANKVDVEVNVAIAGGYTITSTTASGMTFTKTGVFSGTGIQTVTLNGSGTPTGSAGLVNFTVGTAACPFDVTVAAPTSLCPGLTANKFTIAGQYSINSPAFGADDGMGGFVYIMQEGFISVNITFPGSTPPAPGTYSVGTVKIRSISADGRDWNGISGTVYVGATSIEFCGVNIRGTSLIGGGTINSTCEAKMQ